MPCSYPPSAICVCGHLYSRHDRNIPHDCDLSSCPCKAFTRPSRLYKVTPAYIATGEYGIIRSKKKLEELEEAR